MKPIVNTPEFLKRECAATALLYLLYKLSIKGTDFGHYHDERAHKFVHRLVQFVK